MEAVVQRAHAEGILCIVDGAHAIAQIPVNLHEIGADFYASNFHKWLCAPKGSGILFARREHHAWVESPIVSWGWVEGREQFRPESQFISRNQMQGTRDLAAYLAAPAAVDFQAKRTWEEVRERCHNLTVEARERISAMSGLPQLVPEATGDYQWFRQMAAIPLPEQTDWATLKSRLYDEYRVEIPMTVVQEKPYIRVSFQGYNSQADLDALVSALEVLLPQVQA